MKVGLYFGSFNPIHIAHLIIANHIVNENYVDQVWFIVSPQNPLKKTSGLLNEFQRLHLVKTAIEGDNKMRASDVEFKLPRPSFTIDTLVYLEEKNPSNHFSIIMGADSFQNLSKWKNHQLIITNYKILVYNRPGVNVINSNDENVTFLKAPLLDISATQIRNLIRQKKSIRYLVPESCRIEIEKGGYYLGASQQPA